MTKKPAKKKNKGGRPGGSVMQKQAIKYRMEHGCSMSEAMRKVGYSKVTARNPQKLLKSKTFIDILNDAGLTDEALAKGHAELKEASELRDATFRHKIHREVITLDKEDPEYKEGEKNKKVITTLTPMTRKEIKTIIKRIKGAELIYTTEREYDTIAYYQVPIHQVRSKAYELGYRVKGHISPEKHEVEVHHTMSEEDQKMFDIIKNKNKNG